VSYRYLIFGEIFGSTKRSFVVCEAIAQATEVLPSISGKNRDLRLAAPLLESKKVAAREAGCGEKICSQMRQMNTSMPGLLAKLLLVACTVLLHLSQLEIPHCERPK
jgi:hypothetical protein